MWHKTVFNNLLHKC